MYVQLLLAPEHLRYLIADQAVLSLQLPKAPSMWTTTEEDSIQGTLHAEGALPRFWRPEVLGCSVSAAHTSANDKAKAGKFVELSNGAGGVDRILTSNLMAKALKLSFTREIEVMSGVKPQASMHIFNCQAPIEAPSKGARVLRGLDSSPRMMIFYGVVLTVWSAADEQRIETIRQELEKDHTRPALDDAPLYVPYSICILSVHPLFDLLGDINKAAWLLHSRQMDQHQQVMLSLLEQPAPIAGHSVTISGPEAGMSFSTNMPFPLPPANCWAEAGPSPTQLAANCDFAIWPLFKTLALEQILTLCEAALAPSGKVLFVSQSESLLTLSVVTTRTLVALHNWQGATHFTCHARDARFHCADPGSWIIGVTKQVFASLTLVPEVCIVDLDNNKVSSRRYPRHVPSSGTVRSRRMSYLYAVFPESMKKWNRQTPAKELTVAFPNSVFRPLSNIQGAAYEPLAPPAWWDAGSVFTALERALREHSRSKTLRGVLERAGLAKKKQLDRTEADLTMRTRIDEFIDTRDRLEGRIGRLHKRLVFLLNESETWRERVGEIQTLVARLTQEATGLRARLDRERKESISLSRALTQRDVEHLALQTRLKETETAREQAQAELARMQAALQSLSTEREQMVQEMQSLMEGAQDVVLSSPAPSLAISSGAGQSVASGTGQNLRQSLRVSPEQQGPASSDSIPAMAEGSPQYGPGSSVDNHELALSRMSMLTEDGFRSGRASTDEGQIQSEVQKRTAVVADQIARIQQQLEQTLSQLETKRTSLSQRAGSRSSRRRSDISLSSDEPGHSASSSGSFWVASEPPQVAFSAGHESHSSITSAATDTPVAIEKTRLPGYDPVESIEDTQG